MSSDVEPIFRPLVPGRVSIIIPAYNSATTIAETLESCLAQTYRDLEVIVVNDGSEDTTGAMLDSFGARIKAIHQQNGGLANARNVGARATTGEFIAWMDADDIAEPSRIAAQHAVLANHAEIMLVSSNFSAFTDDPNVLTPNFVASYYRTPSRLGGLDNIYTRPLDSYTRAGDCRHLLLRGNFIHPPTVMVRRSGFERIGFFDTSLLYSSDFDWILRASRLGEFAFINQSFLRYRLSATQMSRKASAIVPVETIKVIEKIRVADPALANEHAEFLRDKIAECWRDAAEGALDSSRMTALKYWANSAAVKPVSKHLLKILAKIILPQFAKTAAKKMAKRLGLLRPPAQPAV